MDHVILHKPSMPTLSIKVPSQKHVVINTANAGAFLDAYYAAQLYAIIGITQNE